MCLCVCVCVCVCVRCVCVKGADDCRSFVDLAEQVELPADHPLQARADFWLFQASSLAASELHAMSLCFFLFPLTPSRVAAAPDVRLELATDFVAMTMNKLANDAVAPAELIRAVEIAAAAAVQLKHWPQDYTLETKLASDCNMIGSMLLFAARYEFDYPLFRQRLVSFFVSTCARQCFEAGANEQFAEIIFSISNMLALCDAPLDASEVRPSMGDAADLVVRFPRLGDATQSSTYNVALYSLSAIGSLPNGLRPTPLLSLRSIHSTPTRDDDDMAQVNIPSSHVRGEEPCVVVVQHPATNSVLHMQLLLSAAYLKSVRPSEASLEEAREQLRAQAMEQRDLHGTTAGATVDAPQEKAPHLTSSSTSVTRDDKSATDSSSLFMPVVVGAVAGLACVALAYVALQLFGKKQDD